MAWVGRSLEDHPVPTPLLWHCAGRIFIRRLSVVFIILRLKRASKRMMYGRVGSSQQVRQAAKSRLQRRKTVRISQLCFLYYSATCALLDHMPSPSILVADVIRSPTHHKWSLFLKSTLWQLKLADVNASPDIHLLLYHLSNRVGRMTC